MPVAWEREGVTLRCMEKKALNQPHIFLQLRGDWSIESALTTMSCLETTPRQWVQLKSISTFLQHPRHEEQEMLAPKAFSCFMQKQGPLTYAELLPTPGVRMQSLGMKGALHNSMSKKLGPGKHQRVIPADTLSDPHIIVDHSLLLQHHLQCFHTEVWTWTPLVRLAPTVIGKRRGWIGVDRVTRHSFMDMAQQRLDPQLVTIQSTLIRYQESMGDC
eukprot:3695021-Rhodomonas_salina.3